MERRNYAVIVPTFRIYGRLKMAYRILVAPLIGEVAFGWADGGRGRCIRSNPKSGNDFATDAAEIGGAG